MMLDLTHDTWPDDLQECVLFELPFKASLKGRALTGPKCIRHFHRAEGWFALSSDGPKPCTKPRCMGGDHG